jgi:hypothetical protein
MSYTYLDLAEDVLKVAQVPLTYQDVWKRAVDLKLNEQLGPTGKTPWQSLGAQLYLQVRDHPNSKFLAVGRRPTRFFLKSRAAQLPKDVVEKLNAVEEAQENTKGKQKATFVERDLHPLLAYFAHTNPTFNRGRQIRTKTIFHEKSTKGGYNEWTHPDMVGFYLAFEDWHDDVVAFNRVVDNNALRLFSFELKRSLNKANYRESFFQAVSNSSWAHEGYLVAADVLNDDDFIAELERLSASFGVGIVELDTEDIDSSRVMFPARSREVLDWETINKLCEQNPDFARFLKDVKNDYNGSEITASKYDPIIQSPAIGK